MSSIFKYIDIQNLYYLTDGLTFKISECAGVIDAALVSLNKDTKIPDKICNWNRKSKASRVPLAFPGRGRIIVDVNQTFSEEKGMAYFAYILEKKDEKESAPVVFFSMHSPTLDIPMRVEIPLRAIMKGGPSLRGTYSVYLHALITDTGENYIYYGLTRRGWSNRFNEHMRSAFQDEPPRLFPQKIKELCDARADQVYGLAVNKQNLIGIVSSICATGLSENAAMDVEEYLVDKYSLSSKHLNGLNMIPGGWEGIRALHKLSPGRRPHTVETQDREAILDEYLKTHPQLGKPKPGVAEKWNDPVYAEAVICARENRLNADQVRKIRYLSATGYNIAQIKMRVGAIDNGQVSRVLAGRTYSRIGGT